MAVHGALSCLSSSCCRELGYAQVAEALRERAQRIYEKYGNVMLETEGMTKAGIERKATCRALFSKLLYLAGELAHAAMSWHAGLHLGTQAPPIWLYHADGLMTCSVGGCVCCKAQGGVKYHTGPECLESIRSG